MTNFCNYGLRFSRGEDLTVQVTVQDTFLPAFNTSQRQAVMPHSFIQQHQFKMGISVRALVTCPISKTIMNDPVFASDGFVYERSNITDWMMRHTVSPMTHQPFAHGFVQPALLISYYIASMMDVFALETPPPEMTESFADVVKADVVKADVVKADVVKAVAPPPPPPRTMEVPKKRIALVIGQQGRTVHTIETMSSTKIDINQTNDPCILTISGKNVAMARHAIANILTSAPDRRW